MMQESDGHRIGLSQFKIETPVEKKPVPKNIFEKKRLLFYLFLFFLGIFFVHNS